MGWNKEQGRKKRKKRKQTKKEKEKGTNQKIITSTVSPLPPSLTCDILQRAEAHIGQAVGADHNL